MSGTSFFHLPFEIKIHILKNVDVLTLMELCKIYPSLKECMKEKQINEYFNLSGLYDLNNGHFKNTSLAATFRLESITTLNINSVYWISLKLWISFLSKLTNLKRLHAVDTTLRLSEAATPAFKNLDNLETLAITFHNGNVSTTFLQRFEIKLKRLCLYGKFSNLNLNTLTSMVKALKELKKVWLITTSGLPILNDLKQLPLHVAKYTLNARLENLNKRNELTVTHYSCTDQLTFENSSNDFHLKIYKSDTKYDNLFDNLVGSYCYPFCRKDSEQMVLKSILPSTMNFTELNFKHFSCYGAKLTTSVRKILLSDNTKLLKKLAINFCLCEQSITKSSDEDYQPVFKKRRLGVPNTGCTKSILEEAVDNMPLLEQLEIWECISTETTKLVTNGSLSYIKNIKRLKKLTLHTVPVHIDGQFLIPIGQNCKELRSLKLISNRNLNAALGAALKHMNNLKDLVFEQADLNFQEFFATVLANKILKLNRICFKFDSATFNDMSILDQFLATNDQLIFLGLIFPAANSKRKLLNNIFNKHRLLKRVFLVTPKINLKILFYDLTIPLVHVTQMVNYSTEVCVLDIFKDFIS